jgi:hypothetical protein
VNIFEVLGIEPSTSHMLSKCSIIELHPCPHLPNIFDPQLVESMGAKPMHTEEQL